MWILLLKFSLLKENSLPSYTAGGNVNWYSAYKKQYGPFSKKLKMELPYDPAVPILASYLKNLKTFLCKDIGTLTFTAPLLIVVTTPSGHNLETTKASLDRRLDKEDVVCVHCTQGNNAQP